MKEVWIMLKYTQEIRAIFLTEHYLGPPKDLTNYFMFYSGSNNLSLESIGILVGPPKDPTKDFIFFSVLYEVKLMLSLLSCGSNYFSLVPIEGQGKYSNNQVKTRRGSPISRRPFLMQLHQKKNQPI